MYTIMYVGLLSAIIPASLQAPPTMSQFPEKPLQGELLKLTCFADPSCGAKLTWYYGNQTSDPITRGCDITAAGESLGISLSTSGVCNFPVEGNITMTASHFLHNGTWFCDCDGIGSLDVVINVKANNVTTIPVNEIFNTSHEINQTDLSCSSGCVFPEATIEWNSSDLDSEDIFAATVTSEGCEEGLTNTSKSITKVINGLVDKASCKVSNIGSPTWKHFVIYRESEPRCRPTIGLSCSSIAFGLVVVVFEIVILISGPRSGDTTNKVCVAVFGVSSTVFIVAMVFFGICIGSELEPYLLFTNEKILGAFAIIVQLFQIAMIIPILLLLTKTKGAAFQ